MDTQQLRQIIVKELPALMRNNNAFRATILDITRTQFADRTETENRFNLMMAKLDRSMEKWDEHHLALAKLTKSVDKLEQRLDQKIAEDRQKWEENQRRWEESQKRWEANEKRWEANEKRWEESHKQMAALTSTLQSLELRFKQKVEEDRQKWAENQQRWEENQQQWKEKKEEDRQKWAENQQQWIENQQILKKFDQRLMGMGARWGINSEASFRNALAGILQEFPDVQVLHVDERDDEGVVFGYPEEVELDLIIKNGVLMIAEIKSSTSKSDISTFERKVRFYEQKHGRQATKKMVISPMVNDKALSLAKNLGIEVYSFAEDVAL